MQNLLGQTRALGILQGALKSGRMHHAWIFHGPTGVGKFTAAKAFAKLILCSARIENAKGQITACDACDSCRLFESNSHPDLHIVTKELALFSEDKRQRERKLITIPVEVLEQHLIGPAYRSARMGHGKVFIVDEAELIREVGQNKLLKTLEEPPDGTIMILVTSAAQRLLPTIRSRCQSVAFAALPDDLLIAWLDKQKRVILPEEKKWLLEFSEGSLGRLQTAVNDDLWAWAKPLLEGVREMQGTKYPAAFGKMMKDAIEDVALKRVAEQSNASKDAANRVGAAMVWSITAREARKKLSESIATSPTVEPAEAEKKARPWLGVIEAIRQAELDLAANVNITFICERMALAMRRAAR